VADLQRQRDVLRLSTQITEAITQGVKIDDLQEEAGRLMVSLQPRQALAPLAQHPPSYYTIKPTSDSSVLLGNRYLNRGDGLIISGSSGMGKSSLELQMAAVWALGNDFFGITSNGPMRSVIIQSEDSDGDIAEVWASIIYKQG
jgi:ABC-type uncharacterized transport system fused permease/ATPase subunit